MSNSKKIFWGVYFGILIVLLPHTAWGFRQFEPAGKPLLFGITTSDVVSYIAALAFEAAIAAITHRLAEHISATARSKKTWWKKFVDRYLNAYSFALLLAIGVSALANVAHAVEFGADLKVFGEYGISPNVYILSFGGILPVVNLAFAWVLSLVNESEAEVDPELTKAKEQIKALNAEVKQVRSDLEKEKQGRAAAERTLADVTGRVAGLFSDIAKDRILAIHQMWPDIPGAWVASLARTTASHVSETLKEAGANGRK